MLLLDGNNALNDGLDAGMTGGMRFITFAHHQRKSAAMLQVPCGLVVSSDDEVRQKLAQTVRQCALAPVLVSTVAESAAALAGHEVLIVAAMNSWTTANMRTSCSWRSVLKCKCQ